MPAKPRCRHCSGTLWRNGGDWQCAACGRPEVRPQPPGAASYTHEGSHRSDRTPSYKRTKWERA
jgi:uncharacterized Zn finger protein (UPF0148 family)